MATCSLTSSKATRPLLRTILVASKSLGQTPLCVILRLVVRVLAMVPLGGTILFLVSALKKVPGHRLLTLVSDWFGQARTFWGVLDKYAQQHTVDAYRFELGNVGDASVVQRYIDDTLNNIDNCLARRVAYGVGATMPELASGPMSNARNSTPLYPSLYPLNPGQEPGKSNEGLTIAVLANDTVFTALDMEAVMAKLAPEKVFLAVIGPHIGMLKTGVTATASYITTSSVFYDAVLIGSSSASENSSTALDSDSMSFVMQAYGHGKAVGALGPGGASILQSMGIVGEPGVYSGATEKVTSEVLAALSGPVRFPQRFALDDLSAMCLCAP